jgi:hypothetical protein
MAEATEWLRSNRQTKPSGKTGGLFTICIDLVKLPSEAVGNQREDSRAAAHFLLFACRSDRAEASVQCCTTSSLGATLMRLPTFFLLDTDIPGSH